MAEKIPDCSSLRVDSIYFRYVFLSARSGIRPCLPIRFCENVRRWSKAINNQRTTRAKRQKRHKNIGNKCIYVSNVLFILIVVVVGRVGTKSVCKEKPSERPIVFENVGAKNKSDVHWCSCLSSRCVLLFRFRSRRR